MAKLVQPSEAAAYLGVSRKTLRRLELAGHLARLQGSNFFRVADLEELAGERWREKTPAERRRGRYKIGGTQ